MKLNIQSTQIINYRFNWCWFCVSVCVYVPKPHHDMFIHYSNIPILTSSWFGSFRLKAKQKKNCLQLKLFSHFHFDWQPFKVFIQQEKRRQSIKKKKFAWFQSLSFTNHTSSIETMRPNNNKINFKPISSYLSSICGQGDVCIVRTYH